jgi:hypothetical protein
MCQLQFFLRDCVWEDLSGIAFDIGQHARAPYLPIVIVFCGIDYC